MFLSIVTTLYNSAPHLREFHARATAVARRLTDDYEIVMVDDGSPDASLDVARGIVEDDAHVRVIELSRNFGHHPAIMTGLGHSRGDLVFLVDSDLEEAPELLEEFHAILERSGADSVYGKQSHRRGGLLERVSGTAFYHLFNKLSAQPIPANALTVRLMRRAYVDAVLAHGEREIFLAGLFAAAGFRQEAVEVAKGFKGRSDYDMRRKLAHTLRAVTSFSDRPLQIVAGLGFLLLCISGIALLAIVWMKLFMGMKAPGYASLMVSVWFLGGMTIFSVGLVGLYLGRVFVEVKRRPSSVVRSIHEQDRRCTYEPALEHQTPTVSDDVEEKIAAAVLSRDGDPGFRATRERVRGGHRSTVRTTS